MFQAEDDNNHLALCLSSGSAPEHVAADHEGAATASAAPGLAAQAAHADEPAEQGVHAQAAQHAAPAQSHSVRAGAAEPSGECASGGSHPSAAVGGGAAGQRASRGTKRPAPDQAAGGRGAAGGSRPRKHRRGPGHRLFRTLRGVARLLFSALAPTFTGPAAASAALAAVVQAQLPAAAPPAAPQEPSSQEQQADFAAEQRADAVQAADALQRDSMQAETGSSDHEAVSADGAQPGADAARPDNSHLGEPASELALASAELLVAIASLEAAERNAVADSPTPEQPSGVDAAGAEAAVLQQLKPAAVAEAALIAEEAFAPGAVEAEAAIPETVPSTTGERVCLLSGSLLCGSTWPEQF